MSMPHMDTTFADVRSARPRVLYISTLDVASSMMSITVSVERNPVTLTRSLELLDC